MTRKLISIVLLLCVVGAAPAAFAQGQDAGREATGARVTQGELAAILVDVLGLSRFLPAAPSMQEIVTILLDNNIMPFEMWQPEAVVTRADLARVIVCALGMQNDVESRDDPRSWIEFLRAMGVSIDTIGEAVDNLDPLPEPIAGNVFAVSTTTDPLKKRAKFGEPDEQEFGTDVEFVPHLRPVTIELIEIVLAEVELPPVKRKPGTRD